jgi:2'-5' RNA ligase
MIYAVVHYPTVDNARIHSFRRKYDPQVDLIAPHITLMFPVPASISEDDLVCHIGNVLNHWHPFTIHLQGLQRAPDNYIYLLVQEGKADIIRLHDEIYTSLLTPHLRLGIPFVPHVTLGVLDQDPGNQDHVLEEAKQLGIDHHGVLDKLHLVKVNEDRSKIVWNKEFSLGK